MTGGGTATGGGDATSDAGTGDAGTEDAGVTCTGSLTACNRQCVDLQYSATNCGAGRAGCSGGLVAAGSSAGSELSVASRGGGSV